EKSTTIRTFFDIKRKINMVICDEAHYLKTRDSKRSRKIIPFLKKMNRVLLVTGTPALSRPLELYNLIDILITYKQSDFLNRYCLNNTSNNFKRDFNKYKGCSNVEELKMLLSTMMIRRTKELLMKDLPPKSREHFILECDEFINQLRFDSDDEEFIVDDQDTADILKDHHILENQPTDDITKNNFLSKFFKKKEETQVAVKEEPLDR
ncbi:SNF2/rad54 helicase family protein, partial [Pseudoloma neurophilia]